MYINLHWVIGVTAVGKTTYVNRLAPNHHKIFTGKWARKVLGADNMAKMDNPSAPTCIEEQVRHMVVEQIIAAAMEKPIAPVIDVWIDSMPRNEDQLHWVLLNLPTVLVRSLLDEGVHAKISNDIVLVTCKKTFEYERRVAARQKEKGGKDKLLEVRLTHDKIGLYEVLAEALSYSTPIRLADVSFVEH